MAIRIIVMLLSFVAACFAAGIVVTMAVLLPAWSDLALGPLEDGVVHLAFAFGALFLSGTALLAGLLVIVLAEVIAVRTLLFYAAGGAFVGVLAYAALGHFEPGTWQVRGLYRREFEIMAAAGIVAGFVYWLFAGRNAGRWRERGALRARDR